MNEYEAYEGLACPAGLETIAEAEAQERNGFPWPVCGDSTARFRRYKYQRANG